MFADFVTKMQKNPEAVVKQNEGFTSVIFTVATSNDKATVSVIKADNADLVTIRVMKAIQNTSDLLLKCNEYNSHSAGIITFVTQDKLVTSMSVQSEDEKVFMNVIAQLLVALTYLLK